MPALVKICGLSTPDTVTGALAGGASFLGFVFFARSPRNLKPEDAARLAAPVRSAGARTVAVMVDPDDEAVEAVTRTLRPDFIQLHGEEPPARVLDVRARTGAGVVKAVPVALAEDVRRAAQTYGDVADHMMFDAKAPAATDLPGGNGAAFDWDILDGVRLARPWFLAGGLDPWNVADAMARSRAPLVDVSSGVERGAGIKDPALISAFLAAVKKA
jgi:phosphoribosylanthranilate isomerase